jgi:hypothetical protein
LQSKAETVLDNRHKKYAPQLPLLIPLRQRVLVQCFVLLLMMLGFRYGQLEDDDAPAAVAGKAHDQEMGEVRTQV